MSRNVVWMLFALGFGLLGCAIPPSGGYQQAQTFNRSVQSELKYIIDEYCRAAFSDPRIAPIRGKVPIGAEAATVEMLALETKPTDEEKAAILALAEQRHKCHEFEKQETTSRFGPMPAYIEPVRMAGSEILAELYKGDMTYREFARRHSELRIRMSQGFEQYRSDQLRQQAMNAQIDQQMAVQQQQLRINQEQLEIQRQEARNAQMRALQPTFTNNSLNCTTQYVGNQAYTNCY